jgi:hypothetical protein
MHFVSAGWNIEITRTKALERVGYLLYFCGLCNFHELFCHISYTHAFCCNRQVNCRNIYTMDFYLYPFILKR